MDRIRFSARLELPKVRWSCFECANLSSPRSPILSLLIVLLPNAKCCSLLVTKPIEWRIDLRKKNLAKSLPTDTSVPSRRCSASSLALNESDLRSSYDDLSESAANLSALCILLTHFFIVPRSNQQSDFYLTHTVISPFSYFYIIA